MSEERFDVPRLLCGNLRQEQTASTTELDDQPMPANLDISNWEFLGWGKQRQFDRQARQFINRDRRKARIRIGHRSCQVTDHPGHLPIRLDPSETAAQLVAAMNRDERATADIECAPGRRNRVALTADTRLQRAPGDLEKATAVVSSEHAHQIPAAR